MCLCVYVPVPTNFFDTRDITIFGKTMLVWNIGLPFCVTILQHPEVQKLLHSKYHHFDAVIVEAFSNECFLGFAHRFKAAIIQVCPYGGTHWMGDWVGNPNPYSYVPDVFLHYNHRMNFWERLVNTLTGIYWRIGQEFYNIPRQEAVMKQFFNFTDPAPPLTELVRKTSLLLVNNHFTMNYPKPLMPNIVEVGGMHVQQPKKLPEVKHVTVFCVTSNSFILYRIFILIKQSFFITRCPFYSATEYGTFIYRNPAMA
jgi:glucuronosyltransferase